MSTKEDSLVSEPEQLWYPVVPDIWQTKGLLCATNNRTLMKRDPPEGPPLCHQADARRPLIGEDGPPTAVLNLLGSVLK